MPSEVRSEAATTEKQQESTTSGDKAPSTSTSNATSRKEQAPTRKRLAHNTTVNTPHAKKVRVVGRPLPPPPPAKTRIPTADEVNRRLRSDIDHTEQRCRALQREVSTALDNNQTLRNHNRELIRQAELRDKENAFLRSQLDRANRRIEAQNEELIAFKQREAYQSGQLHEARKYAAAQGAIQPNLVPAPELPKRPNLVPVTPYFGTASVSNTAVGRCRSAPATPSNRRKTHRGQRSTESAAKHRAKQAARKEAEAGVADKAPTPTVSIS